MSKVEIPLHGPISSHMISLTFNYLVTCAMSHKQNQFNEQMDKLIEANSSKQGILTRQLMIRDHLFFHTKETTAQRTVNGRTIPKQGAGVHFDLFDEANDLYLQWKKLDRDRKLMTQCLVLLTTGLDHWQEIRDCLPHQLDAYLSAELKTPRTTDDIFLNIDIRAPYLRAQVEEYSGLYAIYGLSDMLGL